jgi:hypothetical protein
MDSVPSKEKNRQGGKEEIDRKPSPRTEPADQAIGGDRVEAGAYQGRVQPERILRAR